MRRTRGVLVVIAAFAATVAGCTGPKYVRPETPTPPAFKEAKDWGPAQPNDAADRGAWWEILNDPQLNELEARIDVSNNTLRAAQAQFDQARSVLRGAQAGQYPQVSASGSIVNYSTSENRPLRNPSSATRYTDYLLRFDASYELDVWGRVRASVAASRASAEASAADLETVRLSLHAELASNYLTLRGLDAERAILLESVAAYQRALELTQNRYKGGVATGLDVAQAEAVLESTRAQAIDIQARRAQVEHAIAVLVGQPASTFAIEPRPLGGDPVPVPPGLPATLLERRPDIAAAERRMAAANAQIGVARAAFFPTLSLTGTAGFESAALVEWLRGGSMFWTAAPAMAMAVFDGGRRRAVSDQAKAAYERTVALYREATLNAFREVEDQLATLRVLDEEASVQRAALAASERALNMSMNRYKGGIATYLEVIVAQNAALTNRRNAVNILARRMTASVLLVKALGGGWGAVAVKNTVNEE